MKREKLLRSKQYGISTMKYNLLNLIGDYQRKNSLKDMDLAQRLKVSKSYVSQILNGTFDHKLSKVAELAHACNAMPLLYFVDLDDFVKNDSEEKTYQLVATTRERNVFFEPSDSFKTAAIKPSKKIKYDLPIFNVETATTTFSFSAH